MHLFFDKIHNVYLRVTYRLPYDHGINHGTLVNYRSLTDLLVDYLNVTRSTDQLQICVAELQDHSVFYHCKHFSFPSK